MNVSVVDAIIRRKTLAIKRRRAMTSQWQLRDETKRKVLRRGRCKQLGFERGSTSHVEEATEQRQNPSEPSLLHDHLQGFRCCVLFASVCYSRHIRDWRAAPSQCARALTSTNDVIVLRSRREFDAVRHRAECLYRVSRATQTHAVGLKAPSNKNSTFAGASPSDKCLAPKSRTSGSN